MQDFSKEKIESLVASWKNHNKNQFWLKKQTAISKYLGEIKRCLASFDETENEFLQTLYINLSDGNLRSCKILSLGEKFAHAEYFFMDQFFDSNISAFYYDFAFKDRIVGKKELFPKNAVKSVDSVLSGEDAINYPILSNGGKGVISVTANLLPDYTARLTKFALQNEFLKAKQINDDLYAINKILFCESNPIPIKAAMYIAGLAPSLEYRLPLCEPSAENLKKIENVMKQYTIKGF